MILKAYTESQIWNHKRRFTQKVLNQLAYFK